MNEAQWKTAESLARTVGTLQVRFRVVVDIALTDDGRIKCSVCLHKPGGDLMAQVSATADSLVQAALLAAVQCGKVISGETESDSGPAAEKPGPSGLDGVDIA